MDEVPVHTRMIRAQLRQGRVPRCRTFCQKGVMRHLSPHNNQLRALDGTRQRNGVPLGSRRSIRLPNDYFYGYVDQGELSGWKASPKAGAMAKAARNRWSRYDCLWLASVAARELKSETNACGSGNSGGTSSIIFGRRVHRPASNWVKSIFPPASARTVYPPREKPAAPIRWGSMREAKNGSCRSRSSRAVRSLARSQQRTKPWTV